MLSERSLELLTAFVDGELSQRERKLAARLMSKSSEARQIVMDLQENAHLLQQLPRRTLDRDFTDRVMQLIHERRPMPAPVMAAPIKVATRKPNRWATWTQYAMAASLLLAAAAGIYFATRPNPEGPGPVANLNPNTPNFSGDAVIADLLTGTTSGFSKSVPVDRPGVQVAFADLKEAKQVAKLTNDLKNSKAVHLEVNVQDVQKAMNRLDTAFREQGIKLMVDAKSKKELAKAGTEFVIYAENVKPEELTALLRELGANQTFETMTVSAVTGTDEQQVCQLLGIDRKELASPSHTNLPNMVPKSNNPAIAKTNTPPSPAPRQALALTNDAPGGTLSSEVRSFLSQRRQLQPGALQIVVIIRQA